MCFECNNYSFTLERARCTALQCSCTHFLPADISRSTELLQLGADIVGKICRRQITA